MSESVCADGAPVTSAACTELAAETYWKSEDELQILLNALLPCVSEDSIPKTPQSTELGMSRFDPGQISGDAQELHRLRLKNADYMRELEENKNELDKVLAFNINSMAAQPFLDRHIRHSRHWKGQTIFGLIM
jgi:hypothetical protein